MGKRAIFLAVVIVIAAAAVAFAAKGGSSKDVVICAQKSDGALTLASKGKCGKGEKKLTIAKQGPQGPAGNPGAAGSTASIQPEAARLVAPANLAVSGSCDASPGVFCHNKNMHWASAGGGLAPVGFQMDAAGYVHLQGSFVSVSDSGGGQFLNQILYLPPGYRPLDGTRIFISHCESAVGDVEIRTDGALYTTLGGPCARSLDGIVFHP